MSLIQMGSLDASSLRMILGIIILIAAFILVGLYFQYGRDLPIIPVVQFHPPEGFSSVVIGYLIDGVVEEKDVVSLFIYWASKGYVRMQVIKEDGKDQTTIEKLMKIPDCEVLYERNVFRALFKEKSLVKLSELTKTYANAASTAQAYTQNLFTDERTLYDKTARKVQIICAIVSAVLFGGYTGILVVFRTFSREYFFVGCVVGLITYGMLIRCLVRILKNRAIRSKKNLWISTIGRGLAILIIILLYSLYLFWQADAGLMTMGAAAVSMLISGICILCMSRRSVYGMKLYGDVLGFREFLIQAKKDQLEALVAENPTYFYDILPYAYVLGVSDKWINQFEHVQIIQPDWFITPYPMTNMLYFYAMTNTMNHANTAIASVDLSDKSSGGFSSGGYDGGGFSGGGFGGGGGGSW